MKILLLTTYYPPDTAIAAVRPYMFAKYLTQRGHDVTVLRSGLLNMKPDTAFPGHQGIRVITYLGENSPAMRFERNAGDVAIQSSPGRFSFLPAKLHKFLSRAYHFLFEPYLFYRQYYKNLWCGCFKPMKATLNQMAEESFDVVFSTYGSLENIWGGEYAAKLFGAKWIQDFRDPADTFMASKFRLPFLRRIQKKAVRNCDLCTAVSEDLAKHLSVQAGGKTVHTLYNGYAPNETVVESAAGEKDTLSFCYTGHLYDGLSDFSPLLKALSQLYTAGKISLDKIKIHYAGNHYPRLLQLAEGYGLTACLVDHGYVNSLEVTQIQQSSDLYTVLSWNTKQQKGVLTGKFYEGIRAGKPILSIINGNIPHSELSLLNEKYHYGFCYENCRERELFQQLCDYLEALYNEKMTTGAIAYNPDPALVTDFRYDTLAKKLEALCLQAIGQNTHETGV